jgi:ABC-type sugar transport system permease subunit
MRLRAYQPWLYAAPLLIVVAAVFMYPMVQLVRYSVQHVSSAPLIPTRFAGLDNFEYVWSDEGFRAALLNNFKLFLAVPILVALAVVLSAILFDRVRGWRAYRTMLFVPYVLSIPVVAVVFGYFFQQNGVLNSGLRSVGLGGLAQDWLGSPSLALWTIMAVIVWKELGFGIILCLARLMSVDEQLFEAARVDGAGWWRTLWHVTLPQLVPAIVFYAIIELITMLSWVFAYVYVMTGGGPENSTVVSELYIYKAVFEGNVVGVGAAAGVTLFAITGALIVIRLWSLKRFDVAGSGV